MLRYVSNVEGNYPMINWDAKELRVLANTIAAKIIKDCKAEEKIEQEGFTKVWTSSMPGGLPVDTNDERL